MSEAVPILAFSLGYTGTPLPLYIDAKPNPFRNVSKPWCRLEGIAKALDHQRSVEVAVGLSQIGGYVTQSTVLWSWVKGSEQVKRAQGFKPRPSIVLKIGASSERLLIWTLRNPVNTAISDAYNARISYALRAPRTRSKAEALRIPVPGTFLRLGRARPAAVLVTRCLLGGLDYQRVAGDLKDPPPADAWKEKR